MTPEERRKLIEETDRQVKQGIMIEPACEHEAWRRQKETRTLPPPVDELGG